MSVTQIVDNDQSPRRRRFPGLRVPPNLFAIVLGIAGLAEAWHAAVPVLGRVQAVPDVLNVLDAALWLVLVGAYCSPAVTSPCRPATAGDATAGPLTRVELSLIGTDEERLRALSGGLAQGGHPQDPLERQFRGDILGAVTDRYGIGWQVKHRSRRHLTRWRALAKLARRLRRHQSPT